MPLLTLSEAAFSYPNTSNSFDHSIPKPKQSSLANAIASRQRQSRNAPGKSRSAAASQSTPLTELLNNMTLQLTATSRVAVVGKNGCGKTTLMKLLTGMHNIQY